MRKNEGFSLRLREAVERSGLTQAQIADKANLTEVSVSRYLSGSRVPRVAALMRLCEVLQCSISWLIRGPDDWIPVTKAMPRPLEFVYATCKAEGRDNWVIETVYVPLSTMGTYQGRPPYSDWGNIPILNWGEDEVVAWMPRNIPEPWEGEE